MAEQLIISSYALICFAWLARRYGIASVEFLVALFVYVPSVSVFYRVLRGADYVNYQNYILQENSYLMAYALLMLCGSFTMTLIVLRFSKNKIEYNFATGIVRVHDYPGTIITQSILIVLFTVFFTLSSKGGLGDTIFNASYSDLLEKRTNNTEYAAALGIVFWIWSFIIYVNQKHNQNFCWRYLNKIFLVATIWGLSWMFLQSSRMPFILISNVFLLYLIISNRKKQALAIFIFVLALLTLLGSVRELLYDSSFYINANDDELVNVASLPGGASNVFMSFVIVCHYFELADFFYGQTFLNYFFQLLPGPVARLFNYTPPPYFDSIGIFDNYDWNGGINAASIFYANFGVFGVLVYGVFIGLYIRSINSLVRSTHLFMQVAGYFMFAFAMPIFWYELIQLIKPILFIFALFFISKIFNNLLSDSVRKREA